VDRSSTSCAIGADIGGTSTKLALVSKDGEILSIKTIPTGAGNDPEDLITNMYAEVEGLFAEARNKYLLVEGIGISIAGFINPERSHLAFNPNLPALEGYPITEVLVNRFDLPVALEVDSNCATLGEQRFGSGKASERFLCMTIGTGLGGGMIIGGELVRFTYECMGDMGHVIVQPGGPSCSVGCKGCAEALVSATGIVQRANQALASSPASSLNNIAQEKGELEARDVIEAAREDDPLAVKLLDETGYWLGLALCSLSAIFIPDCVALAGGVSEAGDLLLKPTEAAFRSNAGAFYQENVTIKKASLGWRATVLGAACPFL
jgi:glucokinase